jgi:hypothetical protein
MGENRKIAMGRHFELLKNLQEIGEIGSFTNESQYVQAVILWLQNRKFQQFIFICSLFNDTSSNSCILRQMIG